MTSTANGNSKRCEGIAADGERCRAWALNGDRFCWAHSPAVADQRQAARSAGGHARHGRKLATTDRERVELASLPDVLDVLQDAVNDALGLENSIARARTIGYLASVYGRLYESSELDRRLSVLEKAYNEQSV